MAIALSAAFFLVMMSLVAGLAYWVWKRDAVIAATAGGAGQGGAALNEDAPEAGMAAVKRMLAEIGSVLPLSGEERAELRRSLATAGIRGDTAVSIVLGAKVSTAVLAPILTAFVCYSLNPDFWAIAPVAAFAAYLGYRLPERYVRRLIERRKQKIRRGLPDLLDLLVISVDSGLSLDNALADTARDLRFVHPAVSDELSLFLAEVRAGTSRAEALRNLGQRSGEPEMRKLTSSLIQADRFGTSISKVLRTQARYMRTRRRQQAEELAHKVGVKMIFPIFFFIMPSIFLVTAGPAVIQLLFNFPNMARGL